MNPIREFDVQMTRRQLFGKTATGIGVAALASLLNSEAFAASSGHVAGFNGVLPGPHFPAKAKRVICMHQGGAPSQLDLFDYKPQLEKHRGIDLPSSVRMGQRITGMTSGQKTLPVAPSIFKFSQSGKSGTWFSE